MRIASYILSLCLHAGIFLLIWFWPAPPPLKLDTPPIMISLVAGDQGGNRAPSPILGHVGDTSAHEQLAPQPPAPQNEVAMTERPAQALPAPAEQAIPEETVPIKPAPQPEPVPVTIPKPEPESKKPEPVKEEKPVEESKKQQKTPEPPKKPDKPAPKKPKPDPVAEALAKARKATSRNSDQKKGNAIERALAEAKQKAGGNRGGGGGSGDGPGGGGLGDVYNGQIMLAIQPNWAYTSSSRAKLVCVIDVIVDMQGRVQSAKVAQSSGNIQYDNTTINAIIRTSEAGDFPPPPNPGYTELNLVFTYP